jgi:ketosteroid isomerase-like protein
MASQAVQKIRNGFAAWSRGDTEETLAVLHPEIEFVSSGVFPGVEPVYRGHEGFLQFWRDFRDIWERITIEIERFVEAGPTRLVAVGHFDATGRDGIGVERPGGMVVVVTANGDAMRIESYGTWEEAFDAAGVPAADRRSEAS